MELPKPYKIIRFYTVEEGKEVLDTESHYGIVSK